MNKETDIIKEPMIKFWASQVALVVKNLPANAGNMRDAMEKNLPANA